MKFIKLPTPNGSFCYVNPAQVRLILPASGGDCQVYFEGEKDPFHIDKSADDLAEVLSNA